MSVSYDQVTAQTHLGDLHARQDARLRQVIGFPNAGLARWSTVKQVQQALPPEQTNEDAAGSKIGSNAMELNGTKLNEKP
jgi:hypothetical protein